MALNLAVAGLMAVLFQLPAHGDHGPSDWRDDGVSAGIRGGATLDPSPSTPARPDPRRAWGFDGHEMAARAALETLPAGVPSFFQAAGEELIWLNPEPDRWRDRRLPLMDEMWRYDHYIDLENIPDPAILENSTGRWDFFRNLLEAGVEDPEVAVGFAPFAVIELHERLTSGFARWRSEDDPRQREYIEARIIQDAGILGHFVTDLSQPHHTTIHFNGWDEDQVENPGGFTTDRGFHARFESLFVRTHVRFSHVRPRVDRPVQVLDDPRGAVFAYVRETNTQVEPLYRIDRDHGFGQDNPHPVAFEFTVERIAAGALMLRDLWWSAWVASEGLAGSG